MCSRVEVRGLVHTLVPADKAYLAQKSSFPLACDFRRLPITSTVIGSGGGLTSASFADFLGFLAARPRFFPFSHSCTLVVVL